MAAQRRSVDAVICGAGIAGVACARYLAREHGARVLLIDQRSALSYTSSLSTECYRNYWAGSAVMSSFMDRSIDLLEQRAHECGNSFGLNRRGYWFVSGTEAGTSAHLKAAHAISELGASASVYTDGSHGMRYRANVPFDAATEKLSIFSGREAVQAFAGSLGRDFLTADTLSLMHCSYNGLKVWACTADGRDDSGWLAGIMVGAAHKGGVSYCRFTFAALDEAYILLLISSAFCVGL